VKAIDWKDTLELIGIFSILASLIFVAMQLRQEENLLQLEMRNYMVESSMNVSELIIENPEIWIRGNAGEELDSVEMLVYQNLLTNFNDWHFQTSKVFREIDPDSVGHVISIFAGFLLENPGAHRAWIDRENKLNAYRTALDPRETVTSDWIEEIETAIDFLEAETAN
jgi:hypothetical protein